MELRYLIIIYSHIFKIKHILIYIINYETYSENFEIFYLGLNFMSRLGSVITFIEWNP